MGIFVSFGLLFSPLRQSSFDAGVSEALMRRYDLYRDFFARPFQPSEIKILLGEQGKEAGLADTELYSLAGWSYIRGADPTSINRWHPPLGMYIIGLSEVLFSNSSVMNLIFGALLVPVVYLIAREVFGKSPFSVLPAFMIAFDKLIFKFATIPMLEVFAAFFAAASILFLLRGVRRTRWLVGAFALFGLAVASKWLAITILPAFVVLIVAAKGRRGVGWLIAGLSVSLLAYMATYLVYFAAGHGIQDFWALQLSMLQVQFDFRHLGDVPPLRILQILVTGISGPASSILVNVNLSASTASVIPLSQGVALIPEFSPFTWSPVPAAALLATYYAVVRREPAMLSIAAIVTTALVIFSAIQVFEWYLIPVLFAAFVSTSYVLRNICSGLKNQLLAGAILVSYAVGALVWFMLVSIPDYLPLIAMG